LKADPTQSNRQVAEQAKVSHVTVGAVRDELEATGQIDQLPATTGTDGKTRKRKTRNTSTSNPSDRYDKAEENLIKKLQALSVEQAEGAAKETIKLLNSTVTTMKAGAKSAKAA
jgi:DNA-binding transcriptional regulator YhcF (GntR family)